METPSTSEALHPRWYTAEATTVYRFIRNWFSAIGTGFYSACEVHGLENLPTNGPTIICFNHGNGLADPLLLIRSTPRMVRFCAKDTLWKVPIMKYFIRNSGAVPVYRAVEHGDTAKDLNLEVFSRVTQALKAGDCLGFAPEGVSRFLPYMEMPLKTGVARIAIEALTQAMAAGDASFSVSLVPVGLGYTHREKFRSAVCIQYAPSLRVDAALLERFRDKTGANDTLAAAKALTDELSRSLEAITMNAPTWETLALAITASRLHSPGETRAPLADHVARVRLWARLLGVGVEGRLKGTSKYTEGSASETPIPPPPPPSAAALEVSTALRSTLGAYQSALDDSGVTCELVRRAANGEAKLTNAIRLMPQVLLAVVLVAAALPALVCLSPVLYYVKSREKALVRKGPRWADGVAEVKMMISGLVGAFIVVACVLASAWYLSWRPLALPAYLCFAVRSYEEGFGAARNARTLVSLLRLPAAKLTELIGQRATAQAALTPAMPHLSAEDEPTAGGSVVRAMKPVKPPAAVPKGPSFFERVISRRGKRDWCSATMLRTRDYATIDYVR